MFGRFMALRRAAEICRLRQLAIALAAVVLFGSSFARAADGPTVPPGTTSWGGLGWGIGVAANFDVGGARVNNAQIVNGIVRVEDTSTNVNAGFVLEAHYFLRDFILGGPMKMPNSCQTVYTVYCGTEVGIGPFVAIEVGGGSSATPSPSGTISGYALGLMVGFHHLAPPSNNSPPPKSTNGAPPAPTDNKSWNFGIGLRVDPGAKILGDGFIPNQPPPPGEMAVRYKTEPRAGIMLLSSFSF
jgi:hypothetical protein